MKKILLFIVTISVVGLSPSVKAQPSEFAQSILEEYDSYKMVSFSFNLSLSDGEMKRSIYEGEIISAIEPSPIPTYPSTRLLIEAKALSEDASRGNYIMSKIDDRFEVWDKESQQILTSRQHRFGARLFLAYQLNNMTFFNALSLLRSTEPENMHFGNDKEVDGKILKELVVEQPQQGSRTKFLVDPSRYHIVKLVVENKESNNLFYDISDLHFIDEEPDNKLFTISAPENIARNELLLGNTPAPGTLIEGWELQTLDGRTVFLDDLQGQVVLLDFWATWCVNCQFTFPEIAELREHFADHPMTVLGMNYMENGDPVAHMSERGYDWTLVDGTSMGDEFQLGQTGLPILIILDKTGRVVDFIVGYNRWQEGEQYELLKTTIENSL